MLIQYAYISPATEVRKHTLVHHLGARYMCELFFISSQLHHPKYCYALVHVHRPVVSSQESTGSGESPVHRWPHCCATGERPLPLFQLFQLFQLF